MAAGLRLMSCASAMIACISVALSSCLVELCTPVCVSAGGGGYGGGGGGYGGGCECWLLQQQQQRKHSIPHANARQLCRGVGTATAILALSAGSASAPVASRIATQHSAES